MGGNDMHKGQSFSAADILMAKAIALRLGGRENKWKFDRNNGWRWCGLSEQECKDACVELADSMGEECKELFIFEKNGCCFPATSSCDPGSAGKTFSGTTKLVGGLSKRPARSRASARPSSRG